MISRIYFALAFIWAYTFAAANSEDYVEHARLKRAYKFHATIKTWHEARESCKAEGAALAMPMTDDEAEAIKALFNEHPASGIRGRRPNRVLLNFHDLFRQGEFVLDTGDSVQYAYHKWSKGEPNMDKERCGSMDRDGLIDDYPCDVEAAYICEKGIGLDGDAVDERCSHMDSAYKEFDGKCYKYHIEPKTWSEARAVCHAEGGFLAIVVTKEEEEHLLGLINKPENAVTHATEKCCALVGFHDLFKEGHFMVVSGKSLNDVGYLNWHKDNPSRSIWKSRNCGSLHREGGFSNICCDDTAPFICQRSIMEYIDERSNDNAK